MLEQEYKTLYNCAAAYIPDWRTRNKNDLANAYIDNENNEILRDAYFSALMLRYWGNIGKYYNSSKSSGFTIDECYSWLCEAILYSLKMRRWRDPNNPLSKDKNAPDKVINRCIASRRQYYYYLANTNKQRVNYCNLSLDDENIIQNDHNEYTIDMSYTHTNFHLNISTLSYCLYRDKKWFESFLLSFLGMNDFSKYSKTNKSWCINKVALCSSLASLSYERFKSVFNNISLDISEESIGYNYNELLSLKTNKLKSLVDKTLESLRNNKDLRELQC